MANHVFGFKHDRKLIVGISREPEWKIKIQLNINEFKKCIVGRVRSKNH